MLKRIKSINDYQPIGSYSDATKFGNLIYTSGQLPINKVTNNIEFSNDIKKQTVQVIENIQDILMENKSSLSKVIKATVYLSDLKNYSKFEEIYKLYFRNNFPSRTTFEVNALPMGALIEIEIIAEIEVNSNGK